MRTVEQNYAINAPVGNILVTAAAGSGKTTVMVDRIINRIVGDNPVDVDRLLIVTYTNAAAAEIKERIMSKIIERLDKKEDENLKRQLILINNADICTIHSFCLNVVRQNFNKLGIDPNVKIGSTNDLNLFKQKAMDTVLENHYNNGDERFLELVRCYSTKSDSDIEELILSLSNFAKSLPDYEDWLKKLSNGYDGIDEFLNLLVSMEKPNLNDAISAYNKAISLIKADCKDALYREQILNDFFYQERQFAIALIENSDYDRYETIADENPFKTLRLKAKEFTPEILDEIKELRNMGKSIIKGFCENVLFDREKEEAYANHTSEFIKKLAKLAIEYDKTYTEIKKEKSVIDFSDFEHLCLKVLSDNGKQSKEAIELMNKYEEIYIDEYQDCNSIQEAIFSLISGENCGRPNVFTVGDMKQSIYKFRDANPLLIKQKNDTYPIYEPDAEKPCSKIVLNKNFRSRGEILSGVNCVFSQLMTEGAGELNYTDDEALVFASNSYTETIDDNKYIDIAVIETNKNNRDEDDEEEKEKILLDDYEKAHLEALYIAGRIKEMIDDQSYVIFDKKEGSYRHIKYSDIVILMRNIRSNTTAFSQVFSRMGIPLFTDIKSYFDTEEISFLVNLLSVIDNPIDEIPLASVMRHPIFGFNDNQLLEIRLTNKFSNFYECVKKKSGEGDELGKKTLRFIEFLENFHEKSKFLSINELLGELIDNINYMAYLSTLSKCDVAKANVKMLFHKAKEFESNNFKGIFNFVNFINFLKTKSQDNDSAKNIGENEDVVRLMSIHKSKGLEFPVVFLSKTASEFNKSDIRSKMVMNKSLGVGLKYVDIKRRIKFPSIPERAIKLKNEMESISEELRILYVALTRPREKLIITACVSDAKKLLEDLKEQVYDMDKVIADRVVLRQNSYIKWILMSAIRNPDTIYDDGRSVFCSDDFKYFANENNCNFKISVLSEEKLKESAIEFSQKSSVRNYIADTVSKEVMDRITYKYLAEEMINVPRNISVTELKRLNENIDDAEYIYKNKNTIKPQFLKGEEKISGSQKGTLIHFVMQILDFTKPIESQLDDFVNKGIISSNEKDAIDEGKILEFINSPLGAEIIKNYSTFKREISFKYLISSKKIYDVPFDDDIIVQGTIDAYFEDSDGKLVLIDYKTDKIRENSQKTAQKYKIQLEYYKNALQKLTNKEVKSSYIYLFDSGETIKM